MSPALSLDGSKIFVNLKREALALDAADGAELWRVEIARRGFNKRANYSPVVLGDETAVLFNSRDGLWALDPADGSEVWRFVPPGDQELKSAPALGADDTIYFGASRKKKNSSFYALDPSDGSVIWKHQHTDRGRYDNSQAVVGADGKVYVPHGRLVWAFDGAGDGNGGSVVLWSMFFRGRFESGAVIGGPGVLYFGAGKYLYKLTD
jgi:outer membrane protein assembly factor BamB